MGKTADDFCYNIYNIVTVSSPVDLPELSPFRSQALVEQPTVQVESGYPNNAHSPEVGASHLSYTEAFGRFGFAVHLTVGDRVTMAISPLLRWSPHVLYTNLVEPVLRWTFVRKGYALVHAACLAFGDFAYLITARTDTGKTTTVLRILDSLRSGTSDGRRIAFLSDDLTIVCPEGKVLAYPKPLTISQHTVHAVSSSALSRWEQWALAIQSRVHSRPARRFALSLTRTSLPMATLNAVVQLLIPPPKYHVQRLVPGVPIIREARPAGMFVIERQGNQSVSLDSTEALNALFRNSDDAYGFPPYRTIAPVLYGESERDLRPVEREIVTQALRGCQFMLVQSESMDWWQRIPSLLCPPVSVNSPEGGLANHASDRQSTR
jgi:dolichol-phosphate mannosyltransferase